jgi:hypothetical protein
MGRADSCRGNATVMSRRPPALLSSAATADRAVAQELGFPSFFQTFPNFYLAASLISMRYGREKFGFSKDFQIFVWRKHEISGVCGRENLEIDQFWKSPLGSPLNPPFPLSPRSSFHSGDRSTHSIQRFSEMTKRPETMQRKSRNVKKLIL